MKIGLLLPSYLTSKFYGANRIFAPVFPAVALADGLVKKGHEVLFYTSQDVRTNADIIPGNTRLTDGQVSYYQMRDRDELEKKYRTSDFIKIDFENELTMKAYVDARGGKLDIIHSYHDFSAHYFDEVTKFPTVYTLHNPLPQNDKTIEYERYSLFKHHKYISLSNAQRKSIVPLNFVATIYHGIELSQYAFCQDAENHFIFIGRLLPDKGAGVAVQVAKHMGLSLRIATSTESGNRNNEYFATEIAPFVDGEKIVLDGMMMGEEKAVFYGRGKAFLFPLQWEEPFGLVMVEAMSCGTPVIAFARGSAPEIIKDGETGFLVNSSEEDKRGEWVVKKTGIDGFKEAVDRLNSMSAEEYKQMRLNARKHVEEKFSVEKMVDEYEALYKNVLSLSS